MAGLLYFIPKRDGITEDVLLEVDATVLIENKYVARPAGTGPGAEHGIVCVPKAEYQGSTSPRPGYYPNEQKWESVNGGKFFIGTAGDVIPKDLLRKECIDGHYVKLGDGNEWLVPVARRFPIGIVLPEALVLGPDGELVREVLPRYTKYSNQAERVWDYWQYENKLSEEEKEPLTDIEAFEMCCNILSLNYMIDRWAVSLFRLFTTENIRLILEAFIDIPTLVKSCEEYRDSELKKKDAETVESNSSEVGTTESLPDIPQLTQISS